MINNYISIVLHRYKVEKILFLIDKISKINNNYLIFLIDNSNTDKNIYFNKCNNVKYFKTNSNIGYGKGHNITINEAIKNNIKYCYILNYDLSFEDSIFIKLREYVETHNDVAMVMPRIYNFNMTPQWLPKLQPTPFSIIKRKINQFSNNFLFKSFIHKYELRNMDMSKNYNIPNLSGCFLLLNIELLNDKALFDERYFLYFEDYDLARKIASIYKTVLYNQCYIIHDYQSSANKSFKLFIIFIKSYFKYFNKWGWFTSKNLLMINNKVYITN